MLLEGLFLEWQRQKELVRNKEIVSIYFGGGTPSLFGADRLQKLLDQIQNDTQEFTKKIEITIEANPENSTKEKFQSFKKIGINRLSLGVQSFQEDELIVLGRKHASHTAEDAVHIAHQEGFDNISIDLMYELPTQTKNSWHKTLDVLCNLPITHLSLYNLTFEENTPFFRKFDTLKTKLPDDETCKDMYLDAIKALKAIGFSQYEISAFCKDDLYSRHNVGYWAARKFLGFGPSAFSFMDQRFRNVSNLVRYVQLLKDGLSPIDFQDNLAQEERIRELFTVRLRLLDGVDVKKYGTLEPITLKTIESLINEGFLQQRDGCVSLTERGILFYDYVASELI